MEALTKNQLFISYLLRYWKRGLASFLILSLAVSIACNDEEVAAPVNLTTFDLIAPADALRDVSTEPAFSWIGMGAGINYRLVIAEDQEFKQMSFRSPLLRDTTFNQLPGPLEPAKYYYWKVIAYNSALDSVTSDNSYSFHTKVEKPAPSPNVSKYYVSPLGVDQADGGTLAKPFKTLAYACLFIPEGEGDVLEVAAGEYMETEPIIVPLGVSIVGAGVGKTILKSNGVRLPMDINPLSGGYKEDPEGSLFQLVSPRSEKGKGAIAPQNGNQHISGLTIDGMGKKLKAGIWAENRHGVELYDLEIKDCDFRGAVVTTGNPSGTGSFFLTGVKVHDCTFINSGKDLENETLGNLCLGSLEGAQIYNIDIDDQEGYGIKFIIRGYFKNCVFHDIKTNLNETDAKWGEKIAIELWNLGPGNKIYNVEANTWLSLVNDSDVYGEEGTSPNVEVYDVQIIDKDGNSGKEAIEMAVPHSIIRNSYFKDKGFGIAVWNMGRQNILIHHNVFKNTTYKSGWTLGPAVYIDNSRDWFFTDIKVYNNVFEMHKVGIQIKGAKLNDISIKNNLFIETQLDDIQTVVGIAFENNFKFHSTKDWQYTGTVNQANNLTGDPMLKAAGATWYSGYEPMTGSPLIDAGQDVGLSFSGSAPDIGFFEK